MPEMSISVVKPGKEFKKCNKGGLKNEN